MPHPSKKLLWIDDKIKGFVAYVNAIEKYGFKVYCSENESKAIKYCKGNNFDIILVDIKMPSRDGVLILKSIQPLQPEAKYAAFSSYLYLESYKTKLRQLEFPVELIDKDFPNVESSDFKQRFIDPILNLDQGGVMNTISSIESNIKLKLHEIDPFSITLADFMKKSIIEKDQIINKAGQIAQTIIESEFQKGNIWVLLCGSKSIIRASAREFKDVFSEEQIKEISRTHDSPSYQFYKSIIVDDWGGCGRTAYLEYYPTITLEFKDQISNKLYRRDVHFDTGSPINFFSYEELLKGNQLSPTTSFAQARRGSTPYWVCNFDIDVLLRSQENGQTKIVQLKGQAVRDWEKAPYRRLCSEKCQKFEYPSGFERNCPHRIALIGRSLLVDNKLILVLNGKNKTTEIGEE